MRKGKELGGGGGGGWGWGRGEGQEGREGGKRKQKNTKSDYGRTH